MIYLLHFDSPLGNERHSARHYLGFVDSDDESAAQARLEEHRAGWGAKITAAANLAGIRYDIVRLMPGDRNRERQIKRTHKLPAYCPICRRKTSQP